MAGTGAVFEDVETGGVVEDKQTGTGVGVVEDEQTSTGVGVVEDEQTGTGVGVVEDEQASTGVRVVEDEQASTGVGVVEDEQTGTGVGPLVATPRQASQTTFLEELLSLEVWRASLAELLGTAILVFASDTIVISSTQTEMPHLLTSFLIAAIITIILLATIPISGGHINPVISLAAALASVVSLPRAAIYILAQCVGGILGALALQAVVNEKIEEAFSLGGCTLTVVETSTTGPLVTGLGTSQALWLEIICTFTLLFAAISIAFDKHQAKHLGRPVVCSIIGVVVGLIVFISTTVTSTKGYAGVGMNPARCLGPALIRGGHLWNGHWIFWAGPTIACIVFAVYTKVIPESTMP